MGLFQPTTCSEHMITSMSKHSITVTRGLFTKGSYPCQPQRIDRLIIFQQSKGTWRAFSRGSDDSWLIKNIQFAQGQLQMHQGSASSNPPDAGDLGHQLIGQDNCRGREGFWCRMTIDQECKSRRPAKSVIPTVFLVIANTEERCIQLAHFRIHPGFSKDDVGNEPIGGRGSYVKETTEEIRQQGHPEPNALRLYLFGSGLDDFHPDLFRPRPECQFCLDHEGKQVATTEEKIPGMSNQSHGINIGLLKPCELVKDALGSSPGHGFSSSADILFHELFLFVRDLRAAVRVAFRNDGHVPLLSKLPRLGSKTSIHHVLRPPLVQRRWQEDHALCSPGALDQTDRCADRFPCCSSCDGAHSG